MRKTALLTLSLAFLGMLPAMAQLDIGNVAGDFQDYARNLQNYLEESLPGKFGIEKYQAQRAIDNSSEKRSIPPDPFTLQTTDITPQNIFERNPTVQETAVNNEINRQITLSGVQGTLGVDRQLRLKTKLDNVDSSIRNIEESVEKVQESYQRIIDRFFDPICQAFYQGLPIPASSLISSAACENASQAYLQWQILKTQAEQAKMIGETLASTTQLNQSMQYSNLNLASISEQMEDANRARRVDASVETARLLRATNQADLLTTEAQETGDSSRQ